MENLEIPVSVPSLEWLGFALVSGFLFSFSPIVLASIPVALAYVAKGRERGERIRYTAAFLMGMLTTHGLLGVVAALGGSSLQRVMGHEWGILLGPILLLLGSAWLGWLRLPVPWISARGSVPTTAWGAFALGVPFSVALCPACTPALLVALTGSASIGSVPFAIVLMLTFALGRSIPIVVGAVSINALQAMSTLQRWQPLVERLAGLTLIATGCYLIYDFLGSHN